MKRSAFFLTIAALFLLLSVTSFAEGQKPAPETAQPAQRPAAAAAPVNLKWLSINGGGISFGSGGTRKIGYSVGQSVAGEGSGGSRKIGIGFWYGVVACANVKGDMNGDLVYTGSDVILLLNCAFLGTGSCNPCFADVNCDGILTGSDVVLITNRAFLGSTAPPWCGP